jgi:UPF0716 protein FxsA
VLLLALIFIVLPIAEIFVIIQVGQAIGPWWTIALLIVDSIIGARLLRWQGGRAWRNFQEALAAGRIPHREILDGVLIIAGGAFLLTPGFITDVFGLVLLIPPSRAAVRRMVVALLGRRSAARVTRVVVRRRPFTTPTSKENGHGSPPDSRPVDPERRLPPA